ncbi:MAG: hypothetical protein G8D24_00775 [Buchnera aphidicola (Periphyllus lyropictus)]|uniref:porin n=1 Tax=Buchnera aphidicola TaxID=9 RepID=UPI001ECE1C69|nr:porin [Buchnera aphidicola]NIH16587.1 hypothetical protein [Buchnera aphidicola (Periphyllus lyropictus)]USS94477.1 porin [Buchnera aphidicola (Periphyllus lyropictus)]
MNRNSLSILIPLLFLSSGAVNAKEIYNQDNQKVNLCGKINPLYFYSHTNDPIVINSLGNYTNIKLNLYNYININQWMSGYSFVEYKPNFVNYNKKLYSNLNKNNINLCYVGLDFKRWGKIDYGRSYGVMYYSKKFTKDAFDDNENIVFHENNNFLMGNSDGVLTYHNKNFSGYIPGFDLIIQHQNYYRDDNKYLTDKYNYSWGGSLKYSNIIGFSAVCSAFFSPYNNFYNKVNTKDHWVKAYGIGCNYCFNSASLSGFYGYEKNSADPFLKNNISYDVLNDIEITGKYDFNNGIKTSLGYIKSFGTQYHFGEKINNLKYLTLNHHINMILKYDFNKNISINLHYKLNLLKQPIESNLLKIDNLHDYDNSIGTGITYNF